MTSPYRAPAPAAFGPPGAALAAQGVEHVPGVGAEQADDLERADLARQRGSFRFIVKTERVPRYSQMLVGFLNSATEEPTELDPRLAGQPVIDLDYFAPICDKMN